jgi:hypothetical protein
MIVLYILLILALTATVGRVGYNLTPSRALQRSLSDPSRELLKEYKSIPAESRPFPDLGSILKALDEKTSEYADARDKHFTRRIRRYDGPDKYAFDWDESPDYCSHRGTNSRGYAKCQYYDYYRIHAAFDEVKESLKEKERALRDDRLKGSLDMVDELETRLREEAEVNRSFVKEFKQLS